MLSGLSTYLLNEQSRVLFPELDIFLIVNGISLYTAFHEVHNHSADYIFSGPLGVIGLILSQFENRVPLKPVLGGVGSVAPLHYCT